MGKSQRLQKKVRILLPELHQAPPLGPNRYFYISECASKCGYRDCRRECETRQIPYGGQKEFYVRDRDETIIAKWAEKYFFDNTPNSFEKLWSNPSSRYQHYNYFRSIPEIPLQGWCEYKPEEETREQQYKLLFLYYTKRRLEHKEELNRRSHENHKQRERDYQRAKDRNRN